MCYSSTPEPHLSFIRTSAYGILHPRPTCRCLLSAVECGLRLVAAHAHLDLGAPRPGQLHSSRLLVLAGGPATRGPGALPLELLDAVGGAAVGAVRSGGTGSAFVVGLRCAAHVAFATGRCGWSCVALLGRGTIGGRTVP